MNQIIIQNKQIVLRALDKYLLKDNRFSRFYLQKQKFSKARAFRKQSDYLNNLIKTIMATTKRSFEAKVIEVKNLSTGKYLRYVNMNNGEEGIVPEWCITSFVVLPNECIDSDGHVVVGTILKLREMEDGKIYPSTSYQHRANPLQLPEKSRCVRHIPFRFRPRGHARGRHGHRGHGHARVRVPIRCPLVPLLPAAEHSPSYNGQCGLGGIVHRNRAPATPILPYVRRYRERGRRSVWREYRMEQAQKNGSPCRGRAASEDEWCPCLSGWHGRSHSNKKVL